MMLRSYSIQDQMANATFHTISNNLPDDADIEQEAVDFVDEMQSDLENPGDITVERVEDLVMVGLSVILPVMMILMTMMMR